MSVLGDALRWQAEACGRLGSPMYERLLSHAAHDADADGVVAQVCDEQVSSTASLDQLLAALVALRLTGAVHRLVLAGRLPELARHYPTAAGDLDPGQAWPAFRAALTAHPEEVRRGMRSPPQTNEVGRAALLAGGLAHVGAESSLPVRLLEVGASAGLNLRVDRFQVDMGDGRRLGDPHSPVILTPQWRSPDRPPMAMPPITERRGCDPDPVSATTEAGALTLRAYVWPDQTDRHARLEGALRLARQVPVELERTSARSFLATLEPARGSLTVVWHSVVWQYLEEDERAWADQRIEEAGARATSEAPLARLSMEPDQTGQGKQRFLTRLRTWPGGEERILAESQPHGAWIEWFASIVG